MNRWQILMGLPFLLVERLRFDCHLRASLYFGFMNGRKFFLTSLVSSYFWTWRLWWDALWCRIDTHVKFIHESTRSWRERWRKELMNEPRLSRSLFRRLLASSPPSRRIIKLARWRSWDSWKRCDSFSEFCGFSLTASSSKRTEAGIEFLSYGSVDGSRFSSRYWIIKHTLSLERKAGLITTTISRNYYDWANRELMWKLADGERKKIVDVVKSRTKNVYFS